MNSKESPAESLAALDLSQFIPGRASLVTNAMDSLSILGTISPGTPRQPRACPTYRLIEFFYPFLATQLHM